MPSFVEMASVLPSGDHATSSPPSATFPCPATNVPPSTVEATPPTEETDACRPGLQPTTRKTRERAETRAS